jgi:hypothetical protein
MPQSDRPQSAPSVASQSPASAGVAPAAQLESFVINLCSSTTPMALTQPQLVELKSYTFFVSRRLEDGRERFRLHMGYFDSLLQAEELLPLVRDLYPGAWAGEAPGKRLRARAAVATATPGAASAASAAPAPAATPATPAAPAAPIPAVDSQPDAAVLANAPTLMPPAQDRADDTREIPALQLELVAEPGRDAPAPNAAAQPAMPEAAPAAVPAPAAAAPAPVSAPAPAARRAAAPAKRAGNVPFKERSNVHEVLKSLDESGRQRPPALPDLPAPREPGVLPESRVLRLLEEKNGDPLSTTSTPAAFAVQLQWAVQKIDLATVPPLAIFGAYKLYTVEGSHEGRKWYGLRLGFFSDANAAKSVAQYVRSEFNSVAVVPVSLKERDGAQGTAQGGAGVPASPPTDRLPEHSAEFKLLDDTAERPATPSDASSAQPRPVAPLKGGPRTGYRVSKGRGNGNRVNANEKRGPKTMEETLEILGADLLQIEGAPQKRPAPVREAKAQRNSAFSRLLDRLAERNR